MIARPVFATLSVACLAARDGRIVQRRCAGAGQAGAAEAGRAGAGRAAAPAAPRLKQIALTEKQIEGVLAARRTWTRSPTRSPENAKPDPKIDRAARRRRQEERLCQLRRIQHRRRQYQPGARRLRSRDQEICRHRGRHQGADRPGPGRQEDAGQGQEGSARRSQRGAEIAGAGDREQGQYRSRRQILRQARRSARRRPASNAPESNTIDKKSPGEFSGAFSVSRVQ